MKLLVTGSSGYLASLVLPRLLRLDGAEVVGLDVRPPRVPLAGVRHIEASVLDASLRDVFLSERPELVLHLAWIFNPSHDRAAMRRVDVGGTENVLAACLAAGVAHLVYLGSTTAYGAHASNPVLLREADETRGTADFPYSAHKAIVDAHVRRFAADHPELGVTLLRASIVLGGRVDNFVSAILRLPFIPKPSGADPALQFLHEEDLADCVALVAARRPRGVFNVAPADTIRLSEIGPALGRRTLELPGWLLRVLVGAAWALRLFGTPPSYLDFVTWPWLADVSKLRQQLGFSTQRTSREALMAFGSKT